MSEQTLPPPVAMLQIIQGFWVSRAVYVAAAWGGLLHSVRTGEVAFHHVYGMDAWTHRAQHPEDGVIFDKAMADFGGVVSQTVIESYDFSQFSHVVDVGGGNASFLVSLLKAHPNMRGTVQDLPHVVPGARRHLEEEGLADRCDVVARGRDDHSTRQRSRAQQVHGFEHARDARRTRAHGSGIWQSV